MDKVDSRRNVVVDPNMIELIERVVHDEAKGEGPEGRNAVRAVIYNRIAANRRDLGGNTVVGVLNAPKQFQGVMEKGKGDVRRLTMPEDVRDAYMQEHLQFLQQGVDPTNGATFFQNPEAARNPYRADGGTRIGNHVFYDNYAGNKVEVPEFAVALRGYKGVVQPNATDQVTAQVTDQVTGDVTGDVAGDETQLEASPEQSMGSRAAQAGAQAVMSSLPDFLQPSQGPQEMLRQEPPNRQIPNPRATAVPEQSIPAGQTRSPRAGIERVQRVSELNPIRMNEGGFIAPNSGLPRGSLLRPTSPGHPDYDPETSPDTRQALEGARLAGDIITDFVPVVGEAKAAVDAYKNFMEGNYAQAGLSAVGAIPGLGMIARGTRAGAKAAKGAGEVFDPLTRAADDVPLPPAANAQKTQIAGTLPTYDKALKMLDDAVPQGRTLDFGAGLGYGAKRMGADSYEPFAREGFSPTFRNSKEIPDNSYDRITNLNVLNVVPREVRNEIVKDIGRVLAPNGSAIITTRGRDVLSSRGTDGPESMSRITSIGTYQKGFTPRELKDYVTETLGPGFEVTNIKLGPAGVMIKKSPIGFNKGGMPMKTKPKVMNKRKMEEELLEDEKQMPAMACGGIMAPEVIVGYEEESGNEIPFGSLASEVADDVPVLMSEGEVVLPGDVVRWHGLKHIMEMRQEAKMGLMSMAMEGQIQTYGEDHEEEDEEEETSYETPEGNEVEIAQYEVDEDEMEYDEDEDELDYSTDMDDLVGDEELILVIRKEPAAFKSKKY